MRFLLIASYAESLLNFRGPLLDALIKCGMEVHVAAPSVGARTPVRIELEAKGITVHEISLHRVGMSPSGDLRSLFELWCLMRRIRPSHVMGYTVKPVVYGSIAAKLAGVPRRFALITGLGYAFQSTEQKGKRGVVRKIVQSLYRVALRCTHKVFFQNPDDRALFQSLKLLPGHIPSQVVNGSGVDVSSFSVAPLPENPRFLLIARLLGDKGVREYAEAARIVRKCYPQANFSLVGWIDDNPDAIRQQELDCWVTEGVLEYLGRLSDVRPAIEACSVYVLPSYREGTPRTVLEAMAMGRPIITTDAPGCRETVMPGENGLLVSVKNVDELADAMKRFIVEPELAARMGRRSREIAAQRYDVHLVNAAMLSEMGISQES
ncbi:MULTISPECIES: glycosyltransferase family 4 protein [Pseudomonas]|uniref:glycosyltransferase family 4 protein n=1 Tax=Pseudomonas TaxID=286 RepID=UPI0009B8EEA5|nr:MULTISPECIES: glycosyltransferase family 4 protein [Pseudomonas putida group]